LMTQGFDAARLELVGEPSPLAEIQSTGTFDVSAGGVLAYQSGLARDRSRLAWFDRTGHPVGVIGNPLEYFTVQISPDGARAASVIHEQGAGSAVHGDVWVYDLASGGRTRLTFDPTSTAGPAVWSPDGSRVVFGKSSGKGNQDLFEKASTGAGSDHAIWEDSVNKVPLSWSLDGRFLMYMASPGSPTTGNDLWVLPLFGDRKPFPFLQTRFSEYPAQFSPDGRWVAYVSNESGRAEVYVAAFPGAGGKRQISTEGGNVPRWRRDGREIFYLASDNTLMAASVNGQGAAFEVPSVKALFQTKRFGTDLMYDVSGDGQRFLIISAADDSRAEGITVAVNWTATRPKK
jgi:eukaryotic-like serine/threonine-protein kinase